MLKKKFWEDLDLTSANLVRDTLLGQRIDKAAQQIEKSPDLLYKASNPNFPQQLNLKQWLAILRYTANFLPVRDLAEACGFIVIPKNGNMVELLKALIYALERDGG